MEKQFNLIIDTKRTGFNAVRGFKQEENNSVLYINLVQNSIPFDLTGLTVRINFKRPDGQVLLQMADVTNATEGKIKVNILTRVLKLVGEVKADLSIFNKENEKITSASFSMFVDAPIYTNDYITKNDEFDIIQRVWTSEDERIRAENKRKENETNRQSTENTRIANEDSRKVEETKRSNNEKTREDNEIERKKNETNRIENEKNRAVDEVIRGKNEENRVTKESERTQAESIRETNETTRQQGYTEIKNTVNSFSVCEEYNSEKEYKKYNRVTFNGSSYECLKDSKGINPINTDHWICIAEKGKDGLGSGNMHTDIYDKNNNGIVDKAESITDGNITYTVQDIETQLADITKEIGDINDNALPTELKGKSLTEQTKQLFQYASDGKQKIATAVTGKGVSASGSDSFSTLASKISLIETGAKYLDIVNDSDFVNIVVKGDYLYALKYLYDHAVLYKYNKEGGLIENYEIPISDGKRVYINKDYILHVYYTNYTQKTDIYVYDIETKQKILNKKLEEPNSYPKIIITNSYIYLVQTTGTYRILIYNYDLSFVKETTDYLTYLQYSTATLIKDNILYISYVPGSSSATPQILQLKEKYSGDFTIDTFYNSHVLFTFVNTLLGGV
ncbi:BppU family phage baseplate upper protein [Clostridium botulinum]|nr:BppU family phage baseplate upper protein [Clostridium botulinum]